MRWLRAAVSELVGMFVTDWWQTAALVAIITAAALAGHRWHAVAVGIALAAGLALALIVATRLDAVRRRPPAPALPTTVADAEVAERPAALVG